jgi:hypothetical protein
MKKTKKLNLSRETLRSLESLSLGVVGAANTQKCPSEQICTGNTCDCTYGCATVVCPVSNPCV